MVVDTRSVPFRRAAAVRRDTVHDGSHFGAKQLQDACFYAVIAIAFLPKQLASKIHRNPHNAAAETVTRRLGIGIKQTCVGSPMSVSLHQVLASGFALKSFTVSRRRSGHIATGFCCCQLTVAASFRKI